MFCYQKNFLVTPAGTYPRSDTGCDYAKEVFGLYNSVLPFVVSLLCEWCEAVHSSVLCGRSELISSKLQPKRTGSRGFKEERMLKVTSYLPSSSSVFSSSIHMIVVSMHPRMSFLVVFPSYSNHSLLVLPPLYCHQINLSKRKKWNNKQVGKFH